LRLPTFAATINLGNLAADNRAALILITYPGRQRQKNEWIERRDTSSDPELARQVEGDWRAGPQPSVSQPREFRGM
jgi:hypothetical protein